MCDFVIYNGSYIGLFNDIEMRAWRSAAETNLHGFVLIGL